LASSDAPTDRKARRRKHRRLRWTVRIVVMVILLVGGAGIGAFKYFTRQEVIIAYAKATAEDLLGGELEVKSAHFGLNETITLDGVELRVPGLPDGADRLFTAKRVLIEHSFASLLRGHFEARIIHLIDPTLYVSEDRTTGKFNFQSLQERGSMRPQVKLPESVPQVFLRGGRAVFGETDGYRYDQVGSIDFSANLMAHAEHRGQYRFLVRQSRNAGQRGPVLSGSFDLINLKVSAEVDHFAFDSPQRNMLPRQVRQWWDSLKPAGTLPTVKLSYDAEHGFDAQLEVRDAALTIPYADSATRLTGVSGRFHATEDAIEIQGLTGRADDPNYTAVYRIDGKADGYGEDAPFALDVRVSGTIPDHDRTVLAIPAFLRQPIESLEPSGWFAAEVHLDRTEPDGELTYHGTVELNDGRIAAEKFNYPLKGMHGTVKFDNEHIEVVRIDGVGPTGAKVTMTGTIAPPGPTAEVQMRVLAQDVPLDESLFEALPTNSRKALALFFDQNAHARLCREGVIQSAEQQQRRRTQVLHLQNQKRLLMLKLPTPGEELDQLNAQLAELKEQDRAPLFDLGGRVNLDIEMTRAAGEGQHIHTNIGVTTAEGVNFMFKFWPYPLHVDGGKLVIKRLDVTALNVTGHGPHGGTGVVSGFFGQDPEHHERIHPDLTIKATGLPLDEILFATLPSPQDTWLRRLHVAGAIDAEANVFLDDQEKITFRVKTALQNAVARPNGGAYTIDQVKGKVLIEPRRVQIESIEGRHNDSTLAASGQSIWEDGRPTLDLDIHASKLRFDDPLADLIPQEEPAREVVIDLTKTYEPAGVFDAELTYHVGKSPSDYLFKLMPASLSFKLRGKPIKLTDMTGVASVARGMVTLDKLGGTFSAEHGGRIMANGEARMQPTVSVNVAFEIEADRITDEVRTVLPKGVVGVIDTLELDGGYRLHDAHLRYTADEADHATIGFNGELALRDAHANVALPVTALNGGVHMDVTRQPTDALPRVDLRLHADSVRVADRLVSPLFLHLETADRVERIALRELRGSIYGGEALGRGELLFDHGLQYRADLVLQDVALNPMIHPPKPQPRDTAETSGAADPPPSQTTDKSNLAAGPPAASDATEPDAVDKGDDPTGLLSASLSIEGLAGESASRRGRGQVRVRNGALYKTPVAMALLQIIHLTWPSAGAFQAAELNYVIDGDTIQLDRVSLMAPSVEVAGQGSLNLKSRRIDLDMVSRNPQQLPLGALADLVNIVRDELISIRVTGTLEKPEAKMQNLSGTSRSLDQIFGKKEKHERPTAHAPLPAQSSTSGQ
jgi:SAM-dependent methyltransferase